MTEQYRFGFSFMGWVSKDTKDEDIKITYNDYDGVITLRHIYETPGIKSHWPVKQWPPRKVKITVEDAE